jgi:peptide subunit release factor 1 (eRF1)
MAARLMTMASKTPATGETLIVVALDHAHARFFRVLDTRVRELECLVSPRARGSRFHSDRRASPGWGERAFHARRQEEERRHYAAVARKLGAVVRSSGARGVVIGGSRRLIGELRGVLSPTLARGVLGTALLNPTRLSDDEVRDAAQAGYRAARLGDQRAAVAALVEGFGIHQAVEGLGPVLQALERNQVRALLVDPAYTSPGFRCARSGRLVLSKSDSAGEPVVRVPDVVTAAAAEARRQRARVIIVRDRRLAGRFDKVGALLRYG